jgi:hypothetical protein
MVPDQTETLPEQVSGQGKTRTSLFVIQNLCNLKTEIPKKKDKYLRVNGIQTSWLLEMYGLVE